MAFALPILRRIVLRIALTLLMCFWGSAYAIDTLNLEAQAMTGSNWKLEGVKLDVNKLNQNKKTIAISAARLTIPKSYNLLTLADIHCDKFIWKAGDVSCAKGRALVQAKNWQTLTTDFNFHLTNTNSVINLIGINIGGSVVKIKGELTGQQWQVAVKSERLSYPVFEKLAGQFVPTLKIPKATQGTVDLDAQISGSGSNPLSVSLTAKVNNLTVQTADGKLASEKLTLLTRLDAQKSGTQWRWLCDSKVLSGAFYADPVYVEAGLQPLRLTAQGVLQPATQRAVISAFDFDHPDVLHLSGNAVASYNNFVNLEHAAVSLHSVHLHSAIATYVNPFFAESPFAGTTLNGVLDADIALAGKQLTGLNAKVNKLELTDERNRFAAKQASTNINWRSDSALPGYSDMQWAQLAVKGIPFDAGELKVNSRGKHFNLAEPVRLQVLNGELAIDKFSWQGNAGGEPEVAFSGKVQAISLEELSKHLGWTPLSGNISGEIPGVSYRNKTLSLDGELLANVFGGKITLKNLSSSGLFGDFPKLKADIAVDNLDLEQLTRKFEFGSITGRLTGFVNDLVLENWRPVSFFAWFGTPENDDSSHKISQKAVNNIAQIGGGGATDLLSRSFLGFFDTFRYSRIGIGCYLHNGVCQMSGVEAADQGYYLIKGGCLPRIDVMGYNTQVNWDVLVERLARVASPDKAIVQ